MPDRATHDYRESDWPAGLYQRDKCWSYRRQTKGRRYRFSLGDISRKAAFELAESYNAKLAAGVNLGEQIRRHTTLVEDFVPKFLDLKSQNVKDSSLQRYRAVCTARR